MARQENSFALLLDEEGDDVTTLIANVAAKVASSPPVEKKQPQQKSPQSGSAPSPKGTEPVRAERGRGRGGRGRGGSGRDGGQFGNDRANGYQRNNYGDSDGFAADDTTRGRGGRGRGRGGRGRGRGGFNEDRGFGNEGLQGYDGSENQVQVGGGGGGAGAGDGWEEAGESQGRQFRNENRPFRNEYRNEGGEKRGYGGERRRYYGDRDGGKYGRVEGQNTSEKKEEQVDSKDQPGNDGNSNNVGEWAAAETTEVPKDADQDQRKPEQVASQDTADKKSPEDEEDNKMTLDEYEKLLSDKRKALEALKTEERKVTLDKDFESMQVVEKKKLEEILFIKLKSEKDKLKKKDSLEKEEKAHKPVNITEFLGDKYVGTAGRGRGRGRGGRGGSRGGRQGSESAPAPRIEDPSQFPVLGGAAVKA